MPRWIEVSREKQYRTRGGHPVRIYSTSGGHLNNVHGAIQINGQWISYSWPSTGRAGKDRRTAHKFDLVELPPKQKREIWVNVYPSSSQSHHSRRAADAAAESSAKAGVYRLACIKTEIEFSEGEGL